MSSASNNLELRDRELYCVKELRVVSDIDDTAIQAALMRLFNAQVRQTDAKEGQTIRAKRSDEDQALKASFLDQFNLVQSESKTSSIQAKCTSIKQ